MNLLASQQLTLQIGEQVICQNLNLSCNSGEVWGILGPNGSGKTTLLHAFAGIHRNMEGEILLLGKSIKQLQLNDIAKQLGILFQDFQPVFPQTVWEYCRAGRYPHLAFNRKESQQDKDIAWQALKLMELDHLHTRKISKLSGGEQRRLAIAALLTQTPKVYLLDEPGNHLDVRRQLLLLKHLCYLAKTVPALVVMTMHDINMAQKFCDNILLLFPDGEVLQGKTEELLTSENISRLYQHPVGVLYHENQCFWLPQ